MPAKMSARACWAIGETDERVIQSSQWIGWWSQTVWSRLEPMWVFMGTPPAPFMAVAISVRSVA